MESGDKSLGKEDSGGLVIRPLEEVLPLVQANNEEVRAALGIPTKAEVEESTDPRIVPIMSVPWLTPEELKRKTENAKVILFVSYATGTISSDLVPVLKERMDQDIPVIVISDNAGDESGIVSIKYEAGMEAYESGALALQTVNVRHHREVKQAISEALDKGMEGQAIVGFMKEKFSFPEGQTPPPAEWETLEGVERMKTLTTQTLERGGLSGEKLSIEMDDWEHGDGKTGRRKGVRNSS